MSKFAKEVNRYLKKIKCGDRSQEALKKLYDVTSNHLQIVAKVYLRNKSYADDVVIETFQKAFLYIDSFDETQDGYNWLCKIAQRIAYNYNKKFDNAIEVETQKTSYYDFEPDDMNIELSYALDRLDEKSRQIIIMYYFLDYTLDEIGKRINRDKTSVSRQIKKILKQLKDYL